MYRVPSVDCKIAMRILYICNVNLCCYSGDTIRSLEMAKNLVNLGHEVVFLTSNIGDVTVIQIRYIPTFDIFLIRPLLFRFLLPLYLFFYILSFKPNGVYLRKIYFTIAPLIISKVLR